MYRILFWPAGNITPVIIETGRDYFIKVVEQLESRKGWIIHQRGEREGLRNVDKYAVAHISRYITEQPIETDDVPA